MSTIQANMGADYELGAQRKRRMIATYGKATKRRVPKTVFTPVTASASASEDEPVAAPNKTAAHPPVSPRSHPPPARHNAVKQDRGKLSKPAPPRNMADRKRKATQNRKSQDQPQPEPVADGPVARALSSVSKAGRSRITRPVKEPAVRPNGKEVEPASVHQYDPYDVMDIEATEPRLSSPPPTPTLHGGANPPKPSSHILGQQRPAQAAPGKSAQKRSGQRQHQIPLHLAQGLAPGPKQAAAPSANIVQEQSQSMSIKKPGFIISAKKSRKRLIDALAEQESDDDDTVLGEESVDSQAASSQTMLSQSSNTSILEDQSSPSTPKAKTRTAPATASRTFVRSNSALKFTYGEGRTLREEEDSLLESIALPELPSYSKRRLELGGPRKSASSAGAFDIEDDEITGKSPSSKLRGIHELRQAGANSRVADAMQDLIDQIGAPGMGALSSRRAALLQVAEKMQDKTFTTQCRDHGIESVLLMDIGKEADTICCYLILSSLVIFAARGPSAHIGQLLRTEEASPVLAQLLGLVEDIKKVAKDRKSNLSKRSQSSIGTIESLLRDLPIWDGGKPSFISPRCLVIKWLQLLVAQGVLFGGDLAIFTPVVTSRIFAVLVDASGDNEYWEYPKTPKSIELSGALSVLNAHAVSLAATQGGNSEWVEEYLPKIADTFATSLRAPARESKVVEDLMLKLTINVTNNNHAAPRVFSSKGVLPALASSIASKFQQALALIAQDTWAEGITDSLVLRLGILINFVEHDAAIRQMVDECQHERRQPVKELIQLFIENYRRTGEADSMEKTHLNVAFGYLSVLLGYLSLHGPVRHKVIHSHSARSIGPLVGSIREFVAHYEQVENALNEGDDDDGHRGTYATRLQQLVQELEFKATHD
ncbi:wings apart-like protein regulation of heterochromatin-domain-containing protein [Astrocystis sublimbata]|nr:wings apart-like protein regulation of heterochromatin-domain-containing protein [Astrocystis sublimbata]